MRKLINWLRWKLLNPKMRVKMWIVDRLPRWVIYYAIVRAGVYACSGEYSNPVFPELTLVDAMKRWEINIARQQNPNIVVKSGTAYCDVDGRSGVGIKK
jgi:hypothetical protein